MPDEDLLLKDVPDREFGVGVVGVCDVCDQRQAVIILSRERFKLCVLDFLNKSWIKSDEVPRAFTLPFTSTTDFIPTSAVPGGVLHAIRLRPSKAVKHPLILIAPDPVGVTTQTIEAAVRFVRAGYEVIFPDTGRIPGLSFAISFAMNRGFRFWKGTVLMPTTRRDRVLKVLDVCRRYALQDEMVDPTRQAVYGASYGGAVALAYAAETEGLKAVALAYPYSVSPVGRLSSIQAPVHAVYGTADMRAGTSSVALQRNLTRFGVRYTTTVLRGVGHNFLGRDEKTYRVRSAERAWKDLLGFVHSQFEPPVPPKPNLPPGLEVTLPKAVSPVPIHS